MWPMVYRHEFRLKRLVFLGETSAASAMIEEEIPERKQIVCGGACVNERQEAVVEGKATIKMLEECAHE